MDFDLIKISGSSWWDRNMYKAEVRDEQIGLKKHQNPESEGFIWICKMSRERERERERDWKCKAPH